MKGREEQQSQFKFKNFYNNYLDQYNILFINYKKRMIITLNKILVK